MTRLLSLAVVLIANPVRADEPKPQAAAERGLKFLVDEAASWRKDKQCATCHHGTFTMWALVEAKRQGYAVPADVLAETKSWVQDRLKDLDKPRDTRPGWSMVNSNALMLGVMATTCEQKEYSADDLKRMAGSLLRHQEADGSWSWAAAPAANRPPPFFESDEIATRAAMLALGSNPDAKDALKKASEWLAKTKPEETTQAAVYRLLMKTRIAKDSAAELEVLFKLQNKDGGWGQIPGAASDAYATGQVLYFTNLAGVKPDRDEVRRGVAFLVKTQKEDGSWPMVRRGHPGVTPGPFTRPIIYFGSAWATLGLMRTNPK